MKDLLAKLDELHAKATPGEWRISNSGSFIDDDTEEGRVCVHTADGEGSPNFPAIVAFHNHWKEVRAYIAGLEDIVDEHNEWCGE